MQSLAAERSTSARMGNEPFFRLKATCTSFETIIEAISICAFGHCRIGVLREVEHVTTRIKHWRPPKSRQAVIVFASLHAGNLELTAGPVAHHVGSRLCQLITRPTASFHWGTMVLGSTSLRAASMAWNTLSHFGAACGFKITTLVNLDLQVNATTATAMS